MGRRIVLHCIAVIVADDAFTESPGRVRHEANGVVLEGYRWTIEQCASLLVTTVRVRILDDDDDDGIHSESILCCTCEMS